MAKSKKAVWNDDDDALLAELGVETESTKAAAYTPKQERIIAGFEDIQRFFRERARRPRHGEERDIFERLCAVRLDRIRASQECLELLRPMDTDGLLKDERSRRITKPGLGPLFAGVEDEDDSATGYIYVLRSKSDHPFVAQHRDLVHKIGVTGGDVKGRLAGAKKDPTYLLADVEIVATFKLANINRKKLEALLHMFFGAARLDLELKDRFGGQVEPREWFLVPLPIIDEAIQELKDGTIGDFRYEPETASLAEV